MRYSDNHMDMLLDATNSFFNYDDYENFFRCVYNVVDTVLKDSILRNEYKRFKRNVDAIWKNDLAQCKKIEDNKEKVE